MPRTSAGLHPTSTTTTARGRVDLVAVQFPGGPVDHGPLIVLAGRPRGEGEVVDPSGDLSHRDVGADEVSAVHHVRDIMQAISGASIFGVRIHFLPAAT